MSPERSAALGRLFRLLESARPADVPAVLSALSEAELVAALDAVEGWISLPIREYVLTEGASSALIALARHAVRERCEAPANTVDRILARADPEADTAFFGFDTELPLVLRARRAVLRDRQGPDGHAVIPPEVKRFLLSTVRTGSDRSLLAELAAADDPELALALLPRAQRLSASQAAHVIATLDAHSRRREAKRHRGLWAGRGFGFSVFGVRRFAKTRAEHVPDAAFTLTQDGPEAVPLSRYRDLIDAGRPHLDRYPEHAARLRRTAWAALRAGTMSAAEVLENTRPARLTLSTAYCDDVDDLWPGERRAADEMRLVLGRYAVGRLGADPQRWALAVARAGDFEGSIPELFAAGHSAAGVFSVGRPTAGRPTAVQSSAGPSTADSGAVDPANILLALAGRDVAAAALRTEILAPLIVTAAGHVPLCRALVEHVLDRGPYLVRRRLAGNEAAPDSALDRLILTVPKTDAMFVIMDRERLGPELLERAYAVAPRGQWLWQWMDTHHHADAADVIRYTSHDIPWFLNILRVVIPRWSDPAVWHVDAEPALRAVYAVFADTVGVEAVWAFELDRAGSLDAMEHHVRDSMATGDAEPLFTAARTAPFHRPSKLEALRADPALSLLRTDEDVDRPMHRPLENLIRSRLDARADRWLGLLTLLQANPYTSEEDLIATFGESDTEPVAGAAGSGAGVAEPAIPDS